MASFDKAYDRVLNNEGGFQKWTNDDGNYNNKGQLVGTNLGISAQTYERYYKKTATEAAMRALTTEQVKPIYKKFFWDTIKGDAIADQYVAELFFDGNVNHGKGIHLMQDVLNVKRDGVVGKDTLAAINQAEPSILYNKYLVRRKEYYYQIIKAKPKKREFLKGWLDRLKTFDDYIDAAKKAAGENGGKIGTVIGVLAFGLFLNWYIKI